MGEAQRFRSELADGGFGKKHSPQWPPNNFVFLATKRGFVWAFHVFFVLNVFFTLFHGFCGLESHGTSGSNIAKTSNNSSQKY